MSTEIYEADGRAALAQLTQDEQALIELSQQDPVRYRQLHEQALHYLNGQLAAGDQTIEPMWTTVYERLATMLFARDTPALLKLMATVDVLPLHSLPAQHTRQYFQGVAHFRRAQYVAALDAFADLLAASDLHTYLRARTLNARAVVCRVTGQLEEAMVGYTASLELWQALGDDHYQGIVTLNLGIISYNLRRYGQADGYLRQAERFFEAAGSADWQAKTQSELGLVQRDLGNWERALAYFDAYIVRSEQQESWEDVGVGETNRGEVLLFKGALAEAKIALRRALQLMVSRTYRVDPLLYLGLAHQAEGDLVQAEAYYREALALALEIDRREILPHVHYYLGDVLRRTGQDEAALAYWQQAADIIQATRTPLRDESLKISLLGRWQQVYEALILHCAALGYTAEAFAWAERARARAFAEGLADDGERPLRPGSVQAVQAFSTAIVSLPELQAAIPDDTTLFCYFTTGVLEQDIPLLRAIPADSPLRSHILTPAKTLLFVITPTQISIHDCPLDPNLFATSSPRGFDAKRFLKTAVLQRLRTDLLKPITSSHLVIIPHGPLHRVPFTALLAQADDGPTLSFAPSGTIFARQGKQRRETEGQVRERTPALSPVEAPALSFVEAPALSFVEAPALSFVEAPVLSRAEVAVSCLAVGAHSQNLNYADAEAKAVAQTMGGEAWVHSEPKKEQLRQRAVGCRWLHIACHGVFDDADPLSSYLEMGDDERLTAREVLETWQLQAELVALSACETGISQILRGDEPMGLVRAFLYAGARSVLVSQWPVDDLATFLLMTRFYQEIKAALGNLSLSLAKAQTWLRGVTAVTIQQVMQEYKLPMPANEWPLESRPFAEPEFWAGFVIIGER